MDQIATPIASAPSYGKRVVLTLAALFGLSLVAFGFFAPSLFTTGVLNRDIAVQIRRATGLATTIGGTARLSLLPQPTVEIGDVRLADPSGALRISAEKLTGSLRLLPLLAGRFEIARASLVRPALIIDLDGHPMSPDGAIGRAAEAKLSPEAANATAYTRLGSVELIDGTARLHSRWAHFDRLLENVNLSIDWPNLGAAADVSGGFKLHGEPVEVSAWFAQPLELIRGGESAVSLEAKAAVATLSTSGQFAAGPQLQYRGHINASIGSLRHLAELTGHTFPHHGRFEDLSLTCDANFMASTAALSNLRLRLDGNDYEGTLAIEDGGAKPLVSGTLATNFLNLAPFLEGLPAPLTGDRRWSTTPLDTTDLGFADLDLRVSATRLRLADMEVHDAALSLITRTGGMDLSLAEATANHGKLKGRVSLVVDKGSINLRATGNLKDFRLRPLPLEVNGHHELSGLLSGTLAFDSSGSSVSDLMHKAAGRVQVDLDSGEITRLDLDSLFSLGSRKDSAPASDADANAPLDGASVVLRIANGRAEIETGRLQTKSMNLAFGGAANLGERSFDLWAITQSARVAEGKAVAEAPTRINLTGSWDTPQISVGPVKPITTPSLIMPRNDGKPGNVMSYAPGGE